MTVSGTRLRWVARFLKIARTRCRLASGPIVNFIPAPVRLCAMVNSTEDSLRIEIESLRIGLRFWLVDVIIIAVLRYPDGRYEGRPVILPTLKVHLSKPPLDHFLHLERYEIENNHIKNSFPGISLVPIGCLQSDTKQRTGCKLDGLRKRHWTRVIALLLD